LTDSNKLKFGECFTRDKLSVLGSYFVFQNFSLMMGINPVEYN